MVTTQESINSRFCSVVEIKLIFFPQGWPLTEVRPALHSVKLITFTVMIGL